MASSRLPRTVWVVAAVDFLIGVGFGVMSPVLPVYVRLFGVSSFLVGLVAASLAIVRITTSPGASWLLKYLKPREMLLVGNAMLAITTGLMGVADSYLPILIWRGLGGLGSALNGVASLALVFESAPASQRGRANSLVGGGYIVGGMAGPAIGGIVAGISIHAPFFFYSATLAVSVIFVMLTIPPTPAGIPEQRRRVAESALGFRELLRESRYRASLAINFAGQWQANGVRNLVIPLFVVEALGLSTGRTALAFTIAAVIQFAFIQPLGWACDYFGRRLPLMVGLSVVIVTGTLVNMFDSFWVMVVLLCVFSVGSTLLGSAGQSLLADVTPPNSGGGLAGWQMVGDAGWILGPLIAGALLDVFPMWTAWAVGTGLYTICLGMVWRMDETRPGGGLPYSQGKSVAADSVVLSA
ncbi:MAG: MFS transporter [Propionibacteriaceae bacterium]|jgi:MFS family permease|nr:MFS transporter [Propionibacteriaceae bacterium]